MVARAMVGRVMEVEGRVMVGEREEGVALGREVGAVEAAVMVWAGGWVVGLEREAKGWVGEGKAEVVTVGRVVAEVGVGEGVLGWAEEAEEEVGV